MRLIRLHIAAAAVLALCLPPGGLGGADEWEGRLPWMDSRADTEPEVGGGRGLLSEDLFSLDDLDKEMQAVEQLFASQKAAPPPVKKAPRPARKEPSARYVAMPLPEGVDSSLIRIPRYVKFATKRCGGEKCAPGQICVPTGEGDDTVCGCPVLYPGEGCLAATDLSTTGYPECGMSMMHPRFKAKIKERAGKRSAAIQDKHTLIMKTADDLNTRANFDSCAVVGSHGQLLDARMGREIDSHTAVIRFNDAPTKGFERHVGRKTTIRIQNLDYCGWAERSSEICYGYTVQHTCTGTGAISRTGPAICAKDNMLTVSPRNYKYVQMYWALNRPQGVKDPACSSGGRCGVKTSAGWFGVLLAMNLCGKVDVYGFPDPFLTGSGRTAGASTRTGHYFKKRTDVSGRAWSQRHHWQFERHCMKAIAQGALPDVEFRLEGARQRRASRRWQQLQQRREIRRRDRGPPPAPGKPGVPPSPHMPPAPTHLPDGTILWT